MTTAPDTTEAKILQAAQRVFVRDSFDGARMQDIADEAGINKALLHYYFRSKDKLFTIIFDQQIVKFLKGIQTVLASELSPFDKIRQLVETDIAQLRQEPIIPLFIFHEINQNPDLLRQKLNDKHVSQLFSTFADQVEQEVAKGTIRPIDPKQLFTNLLAMTVFPFMAKPMLQAFMALDDPAFDQFIQDRQRQAADFLIQALKP